MSKTLGEEVKADSQVCADQQQSAAKKCKEVCVVGPAHAVVQPHAVVVKVFSAAIAHPAVLTAWPDIHLFGEHKIGEVLLPQKSATQCISAQPFKH